MDILRNMSVKSVKNYSRIIDGVWILFTFANFILMNQFLRNFISVTFIEANVLLADVIYWFAMSIVMSWSFFTFFVRPGQRFVSQEIRHDSQELTRLILAIFFVSSFYLSASIFYIRIVFPEVIILKSLSNFYLDIFLIIEFVILVLLFRQLFPKKREILPTLDEKIDAISLQNEAQKKLNRNLNKDERELFTKLLYQREQTAKVNVFYSFQFFWSLLVGGFIWAVIEEILSRGMGG